MQTGTQIPLISGQAQSIAMVNTSSHPKLWSLIEGLASREVFNTSFMTTFIKLSLVSQVLHPLKDSHTCGPKAAVWLAGLTVGSF